MSSPNYKINNNVSAHSISIDANQTQNDDDCVHVNLRYFQPKQECFSDWQIKELKQFSQWVKKMSDRAVADVQGDTQLCHAHVGKMKALPDEISRDAQIYSLKVTGKARVHGFFFGNNFFLIWLDRNHKILKV